MPGGNLVGVGRDPNLVPVPRYRDAMCVVREAYGMCVVADHYQMRVILKRHRVLVAVHSVECVIMALCLRCISLPPYNIDAALAGIRGDAAPATGGACCYTGAPAGAGAGLVIAGAGGDHAGAGGHRALGVGPELTHTHLDQHLVNDPHFLRDEEVNDRPGDGVTVGLEGLAVDLGSPQGVGLINALAVCLSFWFMVLPSFLLTMRLSRSGSSASSAPIL